MGVPGVDDIGAHHVKVRVKTASVNAKPSFLDYDIFTVRVHERRRSKRQASVSLILSTKVLMDGVQTRCGSDEGALAC